MARLEIRDLVVRFPLSERPALGGISFSLPSRESLLVVGPSGSGKSTLALALGGLIPQAVEADTEGSVELDGQSLLDLPPYEAARSVRTVFQDPEAQFCMLRVEDEIAFGLENLGLDPAEIDRRIDESLAAVGFEGDRRTRLDRLSGGMKQKVCLACALAAEPEVLVLDEPTANLDPEATAQFFELIVGLAAVRKQTLVVVEHKLEEVAVAFDKALVLEDGRVRRFGPPRNVLAEEAERMSRGGIWVPYASEIASVIGGDGEKGLAPLTTEELLAWASAAPGRKERIKGAVAATRRRGEPGLRQEAAAGATPEGAPGAAGGAAPDGAPGAVGEGASESASEPAAQIGEAPLLSFRSVSFAYRTPFERRPVLEGIDLSVPRGQIVALVGPNGSGKSTLAHLALGLLRPDRGEVLLGGRRIDRMKRWEIARLAGLVFQNPEHQFVTDTVFDEIAYSLRRAKQRPSASGVKTGRRGPEKGEIERAIRVRVAELLAQFHLERHAAANPFSLSQGEKRRLSVACMLALDQPLLVLDEPTFGQDRTNAYQLMEAIAARRAQGSSALVITHDMRLVWEYADAAAVLEQGRLIYSGPVDELFENRDMVRRAHLQEPPGLKLLRAVSEPGEGERSVEHRVSVL